MDEKGGFTDLQQHTPITAQERPGWMTRMKKKLSNRVYRQKFYYTFGIYVTSFFSGWIVALKGPSLVDLQQITGIESGKSSVFFTAAAVGAGVGNFVGGAIYDRFNRYLVLFVSSFLYGVTCMVLPWCSVYWTMVMIFLLHELVTGAARSGTNVEIVEEWGDESKPFMQALHFSFSLGATVSPNVLSAFLSPSKPSGDNSTDPCNNTGVVVSQNFTTTASPASQEPAEYTGRIHYAYIIAGLLACLSSFIFVAKYMHVRATLRKRASGEESSSSKVEEAEAPARKKRNLSIPLLVITIILFAVFYFFLDEVEDTSPSFLSLFVVKQLCWSTVTGAGLTSAFWGSYAGGRALGIFFINFFSHTQFFALCGIMLCLGQIGLMLSGMYGFGTGIWISIVVIGLSVSVIFPASLTWTEKEFVHLSGKLMGFIYAALAVGGLANPSIIGATMELLSPMWYSYVLLVESVLFCLTVLILVLFSKKVLTKHRQKKAQKTDTVTPTFTYL